MIKHFNHVLMYKVFIQYMSIRAIIWGAALWCPKFEKDQVRFISFAVTPCLYETPCLYITPCLGLAHSLHSLPRGTVEIYKFVFTLWSRSTGTNDMVVVTRNTPSFPLFVSIMTDRSMDGPKERLKAEVTSDAGSQYRCGRVGRGIQPLCTPQPPAQQTNIRKKYL